MWKLLQVAKLAEGKWEHTPRWECLPGVPALSCPLVFASGPPSRVPGSDAGTLKSVGGWGTGKGQSRVRSGLCGRGAGEPRFTRGLGRLGSEGSHSLQGKEG